MQVNETSCGPLCQHPACWHSNVRREKGFPRMGPIPPPSPDLDLDLPTVKVYNMLEDYGDSNKDIYPSKYGGKPQHERSAFFPDLQKPSRQSIKVTRAPHASPKSSADVVNKQHPNKAFKVVEVQEVFDPEDLQATWEETFLSKSYYVWVPNKKKKKRRRRGHKVPATMPESQMAESRAGGHSVKFKDVTEDMIPSDMDHSRLMTRLEEWPVLKKKRASRSPTGMRYQSMTPRTTRGSSKMEFDIDGISDLLDLPREVLVQVLENTRQSDLMSREKIQEVIKRFMPPQLDRGNTNISLASNLQQKKLQLHEGNKNVRQPQLMETKPVFYLDQDVMDDDEVEDEDIQRSPSPFGSLKELYFGGTGRDLGKYKKPLPSIQDTGRAVSAGDARLLNKIPSISLGLPELPSGIRHTKPFTYTKKTDFDFSLGPVLTPPTSVRSMDTPGSDHGTTIRVNVPSQASIRSEKGSDDRGLEGRELTSPDHPLHAVSPTFSTKVPNAPATTPATTQQSPIKSAPLLRDSLTSPPQDWPPVREKTGSPLQIMRAPVNTPGSVLQEQLGLDTIQEGEQANDYQNPPHPVSRGRSVRFEIPEVPPPPSSPQLSERDSLEGTNEAKKDPSRNTVTVNTFIPQETPSMSTGTKPTSGHTVRTDANTINTSLPAENSFVKSAEGLNREVSQVSSPEPWPQVVEKDYEIAPAQSPEMTLHGPNNTRVTSNLESEPTTDARNLSRNATEEVIPEQAEEPEKTEPAETAEEKSSPPKPQPFVNKTPPPTKEQTQAVKKLIEDSEKSESPAPPPPSPEAKDDDEVKIINKPKSVTMTPVMEEAEHADSPVGDNDVSVTVTQIQPKGVQKGAKLPHQRHMDTFVNIDIPASFENQRSDHSQPEISDTQTIYEEPEPTPDEHKRDIALSVQSTLANRTISEQGMSEVSSSMIEPAMSQASQGPALSEDFADKKDKSAELLGDWSGVVIGSEGQDTTAMLSSDKPDMTEDGGDHEGFKDDLRQEYEKLEKEIETTTEDGAGDEEEAENKTEEKDNA